MKHYVLLLSLVGLTGCMDQSITLPASTSCTPSQFGSYQPIPYSPQQRLKKPEYMNGITPIPLKYAKVIRYYI